ncbi:uncharacterized protein HaLaN_12762, partial [Haematococcus lacustris]
MGAVVGPKPKAKQRDQRGPPPQDAAAHYLSYVQVLATDVDHNSPSLLLFLDKEGRYLFNAGEGLQRMFRENKLRMQKLDNYFFTRVSTETMAGLPGMLLSSGSGLAAAADAGGLLQGKGGAALPHCTLHGPPGTAGYVAAFKPYINQEQELRVVEAGGAVAGEADASAAPQLLLKTAYLTLSAFNITPSSSHSHPTSADLQPPPLP